VSIELETRSLARTPAGEPADFPFTVTRARLDELTADLIERKCGLVREVLAAASLTSSGVDEVLFLGATQRSPLLLQRLAQLLERPLGPEMEGSPLLVAHGAALWGAALSRAAQERVPFNVSEVLAIPLSIAERGGTLRRILDRGTRLPASKTLQLPVTDARGLGILVHQGSGTSAEEADALGALLARPTLPGDVELHFDLSAEGTVRIEVQVPGLPTQDLVPLALDPEQRAQLQVQAPEGTQPAPEGRGLIGGLRRLFQKR
jgi:molecular chaperone DnaK (HSP70)